MYKYIKYMNKNAIGPLHERNATGADRLNTHTINVVVSIRTIQPLKHIILTLISHVVWIMKQYMQ